MQSGQDFIRGGGGTTNNSDTWWGVRENYEGKTGKYIQYVNYKGETWTENY